MQVQDLFLQFHHGKYIMPVEKKLEGFKRLINALKRDNPDYDILECQVGKDAYKGYVIFKVEGTNISIFENFNEVNARIFIVKNEVIDQVKQLARNDAVALDGVESANHVENFENYCRNLIQKTRKLIRETQIGTELSDERETTFDDELVLNQDSETINNEDTDLSHLNDEKDGIEEEMETTSNTDSKQESDTSSKNDVKQDKVEFERQKALEKRKKMQELLQQLEEIKKETNKKIENIHSSYESPEN